MAQRFISALGLVLLACAGYSQAFGRFGYLQSVEVPGLKIDRDGFVANDPSAEKIRFSEQSQVWKPVLTSETEQVVQLSGKNGAPEKASFNLLGVGFSLYFDSGINFKVRCKDAPYLTWQEGSVAQNVATPSVGWLVLSFRDRQPPLIIGFPGGPTSLIVTGVSGAWSIQCPDKFKGWVRIGLPDGLDAKLANTAGTLGRLAKDAAPHSRLWTSMPPKLLKTSFAEDLYSVTATWQFDHGGAVVPGAAELAYLGGYPIEIKSITVRLPGWTESGPVDVVKGDSISIRFPVRRVPTGRCLAVGGKLSAPLTAASPQDLPKVCALALSVLTSERDPLTRKAAEDTVSDFVSQTPYFIEPWTHQQLPYSPSGKGIDLVAAQAFLMQAVTITSRATSESNSLLTSVCWRQDWLTWTVWTQDAVVAQRAGAFAAIAGALCPEPERRLSAAMFQAGLSARHGLDIWRKRQDMIPDIPKIIEPLSGVRKALFGLNIQEDDGEAFALTLMSPLRVFGDSAVKLERVGSEYRLKFLPPKSKTPMMMIASAYPVVVTDGANLHVVKVASALGFTEIHYAPTGPGPCEIKLDIPSYGKLPPAAAAIPTYSEVAK